MSDLKKYLVLAVVIAAMAILGRLAWEWMFPVISNAASAVPTLFGAVPGWVWWMIFGISMSFLCPLKAALFGRSCRTSCSPRRSSA